MFKLGIERIDEYLDIFKDKGVGLITNPTGVNRDFISTIDILAKKTNLKALFSPEHGVRGNIQAGVKLDTYIDKETGIPVYSLYGDKRAPTEEMLEGIDIIAYDIQDVGARFYTYIYTLAYTMQAAKRMNKKVVVFDRPNLVGNKVEGNILDLKYRSFIGYYSIPQRYGLTVGELANLFNKEFEIDCDLVVIPMSGYKNGETFYDLKIPYVLPSPNLPTIESCFVYLGTCIFEGTNVSEGRGTTKPFSFVGAPWINSRKLLKNLKKHNLEGIKFRSVFFTPTMSKHKDELCEGVEVYITDYKKASPVIMGMILLKEIEALHKEFKFNPPWTEGREPMINLNVGNDFIKEGTKTLEEVKALFKEDEAKFKVVARRYYLYE